MRCFAKGCKNSYGERAQRCSELGALVKANAFIDKNGRCMYYKLEGLPSRKISINQGTICAVGQCLNHCGITCLEYGMFAMGAEIEIGYDGRCAGLRLEKTDIVSQKKLLEV